MKTRPRRALDFVLGFVAGGAIVILAAGLVGGIWGDDWWAAVRGFFWHG